MRNTLNAIARPVLASFSPILDLFRITFSDTVLKHVPDIMTLVTQRQVLLKESADTITEDKGMATSNLSLSLSLSLSPSFSLSLPLSLIGK